MPYFDPCQTMFDISALSICSYLICPPSFPLTRRRCETKTEEYFWSVVEYALRMFKAKSFFLKKRFVNDWEKIKWYVKQIFYLYRLFLVRNTYEDIIALWCNDFLKMLSLTYCGGLNICNVSILDVWSRSNHWFFF